MTNIEIAEKILEYVGGKENVQSVTHCATRLRIMVIDKEKIKKDDIESIDSVKGSFFNSGQFQVILGTGLVNKVHDEFVKIVGDNIQVSLKEMKHSSGNRIQRAVRVLGDVFVPIIPVLVATGLFMGLRGLIMQEQVLKLFGLTVESVPQNLVLFKQILTDTAFAFLPALVCWSAFKIFDGSPIIGFVIGLMLTHSALPNAYDVASGNAEPLVFFNFIKLTGYQGSVLPAFIIGITGANIEKFLHKHIPDILDLVLVPFLTMLISILLGLFFIGLLFHSVESIVLVVVEGLINLPFGIGGFIYGCFDPLLGVFGIHHILSVLEINMLATTGWNMLTPIGTCANMAQAGAVLAVAVKAKNIKTKQIAYPSSISAMLGITEPAVFGVTLRFVKPYIMAMLAGSIGGFVASILKIKATGMGLTGIPGILLYLNNQLPLYLLVNIISFLIAFILTYLFGFKENK